MFNPITIPFGSKMLFNAVKLKPGVTPSDIELALGEMCHVVKETYGNEAGGFIAGQVFAYAGFISQEGSVNSLKAPDYDVAIVTYWTSFEQHEKSHADKTFNDKFSILAEKCSDSFELGFDMLWQGVPGE
ncbi:MAG: hypothetical protein Q8Q28_00725 [Pseudomonadota bacterium]|nr:hypothetical protein [Pseudomonadota bacterium]